jgi:Mg-chelatase subunit ChlD
LPTNQNFNDDDDLNLQAPSAAASEQPEPDPAVVGDGALSVNTRVEYSALPRGQMQDVFGLVTVQGSAAPAPEPDPSDSSASTDDERQPMDLICVLDVSGSMRGDKIRQVQDAMRFIIDQAIPKDRLSIVTFNQQGQRVLRLRKMDMEGKNSATVTTLQLSAGGGTSIASGLSTALDVMEQRRQRNKVSAILLLTDGQDGSTRHQLPALIARAQQANCSIYGFGFGKDHDAALLSDLAEQAQTPFTFVENTENIREAFAGAVGGLSSIVAQAVELTITSHVQLKNVHTPFATRMTSATCACVTIPDIFAGEKRNILVELSVPTSPTTDDKTKLLEAQVSYRDLRSGILMQTPVSVMEASVVEEPQPEAEPDA